MKIIFCLFFLIVFFNASLFAQCPFDDCINDGLTKATAYEIWTKAHLIELNDSADSIGPPYYMSWVQGKHFRLMQDIKDINQPISGLPNAYFYGNGKTITVAMDVIGYGGLLGAHYIDSLTVNGYINVQYQLQATAAGIGGAITITHCTSNVIIHLHNATMAGGIASVCVNNGTISNCVFNGSITGLNRLGGIVGSNDGTVINCVNNGRITATNSGSNTNLGGQPTSNNGVGGIVGHTTNGCQSVFGNINTGTIEGQGMVGGIVGTVRALPSALIISNLNYGFVKGTNKVGGIVGWIFNAGVAISNNSNFGVVVGEEDTGCIVGKNNGGNISNNHYDKQMCGE